MLQARPFYNWMLIVIFQPKRQGLVKYLGESDSACATASIKEAQVPPRGQTFSGQKVQVASRNFSSRQTLLQAEVLRDKNTPVHSNDALGFLLHTAVPVLLESADWGFAN
jgi:hypothetical protein